MDRCGIACTEDEAEIVGEDPSRILFVANHPFDCIGAKSYGVRTAFIDRRLAATLT